MNKTILLLVCTIVFSISGFSQKKTENLIIITLDGMRWQEVFGGVDTVLVNNKNFTKDSAGIMKNFWSDDVAERRTKLFPFFWSTVAKQGQVYGNRNYGN